MSDSSTQPKTPSTHIHISGKCIAPAYRGNVYYSKDDSYSYDYPIKKGVAGLPTWFEIDKESLKDLAEAEKKAKASKKAATAAKTDSADKAPAKAPSKSAPAVKADDKKVETPLV